MRLKSLSCYAIILLAMLGLVWQPVLAAKPLSGLQVTPLRTRPILKPGDTAPYSIKVTNNSDKPIVTNLDVEQFKTTDEAYNYQFSKPEHPEWVRLADSSVSLKPSESKQIAYSLAIPANAPPGGYYFAIIASSSSQTGGSLNEIKRVASLIYLEVGGTITRKLNMLGVDLPWITTKPTLTLNNRLSNSGNSHTEADVTLETKLLPFGPSRLQQAKGLILPGTIRLLPATVKISFWPGVYKVQTRLSPPQGGLQTTTNYIVYMPIWAWVILLVLIGFLTKPIWSRKKFRA